MLDTGDFPWMNRDCEDRGAITKAEIQTAVNAVWTSLTDEALAGLGCTPHAP